MMDLLQRLSHQNDFRFHRDGTQKVETIRLTYYEEVCMPRNLHTISSRLNAQLVQNASWTMNSSLTPPAKILCAGS